MEYSAGIVLTLFWFVGTKKIASKNYISDADIIELAARVNKILHVNEPYGFIKKLDDYEK